MSRASADRTYTVLVLLSALTLFLMAGGVYYLFFRDLRIGYGSPLFVFSVISMSFVAVIFLRYFTFAWLSYVDLLSLPPAGSDRVHTASLMVPVFNEGTMVESCLVSLTKQDHPAFEIIVIDDGSKDDTLPRARSVEAREDLDVPVRVFTQKNGGKANALNHAIRQSHSEIVISVDGDSMLAPDALSAACKHFDDPTVGAVAGNVKVLNRNKLIGRLQALEYIEGLNLTRRAMSYLGLVNIIPGPIGVFRRKIVEDIGGYTTDTFAEDADITLRVLRQGWRIVYEPKAISYTEAPETFEQFTKQRYRWTRGILQAIRKHSDLLFRPKGAWPQCAIMWYMLGEAVIWPFAHIGLNLALLVGTLLNGFEPYLFFWWVQLLILDIVAALHCVIVEEEDWGLVLHAFFYRLFFVLFVDMQRVLATFEEFLGHSMTWGKLTRVGQPRST